MAWQGDMTIVSFCVGLGNDATKTQVTSMWSLENVILRNILWVVCLNLGFFLTRPMVPSVAEFMYLDKIEWLEMYGVDLHPVKEPSVRY
ncbi:uncharacterized protein [Montipora foliosa]|uniref:uncharacterized protein isoform X2 n=1 Tax=Montipora foliosa TaxID=591990 RepID=UPI0035F180C2